MLMFLFGIIATGQTVWRQNGLNTSVAAAARCASVNPILCGTAGQIQAYAAKWTSIGFSPSVFSVTTAQCGNQITASYPTPLLIPFLSLSVTLRAQACYPI